MCNDRCHFTFSWSLLIAHHVAKVLMTSSWHVQLPHLSGFIFTSMSTSENFELKLALRPLVTLIYVDIRKSDINCSHAPGRVTEQVKIVRISTNDCGWNIYITQSTLFPHSKWYNHRKQSETSVLGEGLKASASRIAALVVMCRQFSCWK